MRGSRNCFYAYSAVDVNKEREIGHLSLLTLEFLCHRRTGVLCFRRVHQGLIMRDLFVFLGRKRLWKRL